MKVSIIGGGTIGTSIAIPLKNNGYDVIVTRRNTSKIEFLKENGVEITSDNKRAVENSQVVILTLKPLDTVSELKKLANYTQGKIIISMAAAVSLKQLKTIAPKSYVVRAMTNIAASVGAGFTPYCVYEENEQKIQIVRQILGSFGESEKVEEKYMDALTALSGSGPAYILTIIESMMYGGLKVGLPRELSLKASYQTVLGSAKLLAQSRDHPSELKEKVITPGGVTIEGIFELENMRIRTAIMRAIEASTAKSKEISKEIEQKVHELLNN